MMNDDEWTYQDEDFDPDSTYIELQFGIDDVYLIYKSLQVNIDQWPGDISIILVKQIPTFILKIRFPKRSEIKTLCKNIWMQMRDSQEFR